MALVALSALPSSSVVASSDISPFVIGGTTKKMTAGAFRTALFAFAAADPLNVGPLTAVGNSTITGALSGITALTIGGALTGVTSLTMSGALSGATTIAGTTLQVTAAVGKILPGATSLSLRNNADSADNLLASDAGLVTIRAGLTLTAGALTFGAAVSKIVPGATSISHRNTADSADNILIADTGLITLRSDLFTSSPGAIQLRIKDTSQAADAKEWALQNTTGLFRLRAVNDAVSTGTNALTVSRSGANCLLLTLMPDAGTVTITPALTLSSNLFLANNKAVYGRNAGGTQDVAIGYVSGADYVTIGGDANQAGVIIQGFGTLSKLGFFASTGSAKATVTGSKGANAALASLLTALAGYGLLTDSST